MEINRNVFPIAFEPVEKLIDAAYVSDDFSSVDAVIARNTVRESSMVSRLMNGTMDAYCWSSGDRVSHMLSRTSHPGYTLQLTDFFQGRAIGDIDIKHASELTLPDGACAVGVMHADLGIESELAESFAGEYGAAAMIPYNVFEEVVDEHDTNYLIALAISIDQLPEHVTDDEISRRIRLNADQDMDERRGLTVREQDAPSVSLDELAEVYGDDKMEADEVEVALER